MSFSMVNADGHGDYFAGLPADCQAGDDIEHDLGDVAEASLAEALGFIRTGGLLGSHAGAGHAPCPVGVPPATSAGRRW